MKTPICLTSVGIAFAKKRRRKLSTRLTTINLIFHEADAYKSLTNALVAAYDSRLPITKAKKNDLLELSITQVIPLTYKPFFEQLPSSNIMRGTAPEIGLLDSESEDDE